MSVAGFGPADDEAADGTAENANLIFGPLADFSSQSIAQSFVVTTEGGNAPQIRRDGRGRHVLPPPDAASLGTADQPT